MPSRAWAGRRPPSARRASLATLLTECVVVAGQLFLVRSQGVRVGVPGAGRILAVSAVMGGVVALLLGKLNVLLLVALGAAVYVGTALLLDAIPEDVRAMFTKAPPGPSRESEV